jgi:enoyl-CoA hydratase/carnithine racemase
MGGGVGYERRGAIGVISLDRAEKRNALDLAMFAALGDAAERAGDDREARAVVVRGEGSAFCAGIDLGALAGLAGQATERFPEFVETAQRPYRLLALLDKPVVAAVQGHAVGAGFQLALAADLRVATPNAVFGLLEARFGLIPDLGGMWHLAREIGPARTKELAWTARTFDADEAERLGIVHRLVAADELDEAAMSLAAEVASHSPASARLTKKLVREGAGRTLEEELAAEAAAQLEILQGEDQQEAVAAFLERRPPRFTGR